MQSLSLEGLSFKIEAGKNVIIFGEASSGKTSIANLILRFYDPLAGEINIDGHNLKDLHIRNYRSQIGISFHNNQLHHSDINENIKAGRNVSDDDVEVARQILDHPINTFPKDYVS